MDPNNNKKKKEQLTKEPSILREQSINKNVDFIGTSLRDRLYQPFLDKVLNQGLKEPFNFNHLFKMPEYMSYEAISAKMKRMMTPQVKKDIISGRKTLFKFYEAFLGKERLIGNVLMTLSENIAILIPIILKRLIDWIEDFEAKSSADRWKGIRLAFYLSFVMILTKLLLFSSRYYVLVIQVYAQAFAAVCSGFADFVEQLI